MADVPRTARCVVIGAGIVGNSLVHHLARLGWRDIVQIDQGPLPNPGGSTGHASNFIFPVDHSREITDLTLDSVRAVQGDRRLHPVRRLRGRPHRGADGGAPPPDVLGEGLGHRGRAGQPRVRPGEGAVPRQGPDHRRVLAAGRSASSTRCAPARSCASGRSRRARSPSYPNVEVTGLDVEDGADPPRAHRPGRDRGRVRRHRLRRVEPQDRRHGRRQHPADPGRAPDDQRRPLPAAGRDGRARSPSRSCATWTPSATSASTAPTWRSAPTPTARSCMSPRTSPRSSRPSCRRPRCRSPTTTSTRSSSRPTS